jgi:hypothetical protein
LTAPFFEGQEAGLMTTEYSLQKMKLKPIRLMEQMLVHDWTWRSGGAVCGLFLGIISPILGAILTAIAWFTGPEWHGLSLHRDGTVLFFLTIPLLILGAHCLDLSEGNEESLATRNKRRYLNEGHTEYQNRAR